MSEFDNKVTVDPDLMCGSCFVLSLLSDSSQAEANSSEANCSEANISKAYSQSVPAQYVDKQR